MNEYEQYAQFFPSLVAMDADPDPKKCICRGSGWVLSQLDSYYPCPCHPGKPHPEDDMDDLDKENTMTPEEIRQGLGRNSNLSSSDLSGSDLSGSNLSGSDLKGCKLPSPPMVLLANWRDVSDSLCLELMRYDCANLDNGEELFRIWKETGKCPFKNARVQRSANFTEKRDLWTPGPTKTALELMHLVLAEKCKGV